MEANGTYRDSAGLRDEHVRMGVWVRVYACVYARGEFRMLSPGPGSSSSIVHVLN